MNDIPVAILEPLRPFAEAGVLDVVDLQVAQTLARLTTESRPTVVLAAALAVKAMRDGSVCLDLNQARDLSETEPLADGEELPELEWPEPLQWLTELGQSSMIADISAAANAKPFRLAGSLLYLERSWSNERRVALWLDVHEQTTTPAIDESLLTQTLDALFDGAGLAAGEPDLQREAVEAASRSWVSVIAGGPGTGKTTTVAKLLMTLARQSPHRIEVALAAPSGKAAARLYQSVSEELAKLAPITDGATPWPKPHFGVGQTLHKLLGSKGPGNGFSRGPGDPLPHDVVIVDEASMADLSIFAVLISAIRPGTRVVLVGDPHQLSSVQSGRVLADITHSGLTIGGGDQRPAVVELTHNWRFNGALADLAAAIRIGDADAALDILSSPADQSVVWVADDVSAKQWGAIPALARAMTDQARVMVEAAQDGAVAEALEALDSHRLLCAHLQGPYGVSMWSRSSVDEIRAAIPGYPTGSDWFPGRPVLATVNAPVIRVSNGDSGVVATPEGNRLALAGATETVLLNPSLVDGLQSMYALTVHKSQGSQFGVVTAVMPPVGSLLLTREMIYTAVTRARHQVRVIGSAEAIRDAIAHPTRRVSGLIPDQPSK